MPKSKRLTGNPVGGRTVLYRHYDAEGRLLYVGISGTPENRTRWHKRHAEWVDQAVRFTGVWYRTRLAALAAEWKAIQEEHPLYNRQGMRGDAGKRTLKPLTDRATNIFTVRLDEAMIDEIDELTHGEDANRSDMIRTLLDEGRQLREASRR